MSRFFKGNQDPDAVYDDAPVSQLILTCRRNGAMSVEGCIENEMYALAMLDNARDAVRNYNARKRIDAGLALTVPANDTPLAAGSYRPSDPMKTVEERFQ